MRDTKIYTIEELKYFLKEFLSEYRKQVELSRVPINNLTDFRVPTQLHILWFTPYDQQYFFITHFEELVDGSIFILQTSYYEAADNLVKWTELPCWNRPIKGWAVTTAKEFLISSLERILKLQPERIYWDWVVPQRKEPIITLPTNIQVMGKWMDGFQWEFRGILKLNMTEWMKLCFEGLKLPPPQQNILTSDSKVEVEKPAIETITACGAIFFPTVWLGEPPFDTLSKRLHGIRFPETEKIVIQTTFRGFPLWISRLGYIYLGCSEKYKALDLLNELMAYFRILTKIPTRVVRIEELGEGTLDLTNNRVKNWHSTAAGDRGWILEKQFRLESADFDKYRGRITPIPVERFQDVLDLIKMTSKGYSDILTLQLEAFTQFDEKAYRASFLLGWTLIESLLIEKWRIFLESEFEERIVSKNRREMWDSPNWTISIIIRSLQVSGLIADQVVNLLFQLKSKRNAIVHKGIRKQSQVTKEHPNVLLELASWLLWKFIQNKPWDQLSIKETDDLQRWTDQWMSSQ